MHVVVLRTQQDQIVEAKEPVLTPVFDVVSFGPAAGFVAVLECAGQHARLGEIHPAVLPKGAA